MLKPAEPLVSVCIPVYNCDRYIGQAIESVLSQTYPNLELVIINDDSTDQTLDVVRSYLDPRIRVVMNERRLGHQDNWNKALTEARGEFLKLLPADDLLYPDCLRRELEILAAPENKGVALVCCSRDVIDSRGKVLLKRSFKSKKARVNGSQAIRASIRAGTNLIGEPGAVLLRSEDARQAGLFDARYFYVIDLDYWRRLLARGDLYIIPDVLCAFRVAKGSASVSVAASQSRDFRRFIRELRKTEPRVLSGLDCLIGEFMALANRWLRSLFYRLIVRES